MSTIKQLPHHKRNHATLGAFAGVAGISAVAATYLKKHGEEGSLVYLYALVPLFVFGIVLVLIGRQMRCPDCRKLLRDGADHPRTDEVYLYYCKHCDVIWDSAIARSKD